MFSRKIVHTAMSVCLTVAALVPGSTVMAATVTQVPSSDGTYRQWAVSTGSQHYQTVDESVCNGTADYVSTSVTGRRDSFGIDLVAIPNGSTITSIELTPCASRSSGSKGGSSVMNVFYRLNGVNSANAGAYVLTGTTPTVRPTTEFSGLSIAKDAATSLQAGVAYSSGTRGARVSQLSVRITYTPPAPPTPPAAPGNLQAVNIPGVPNRNDLTWSDLSSDEAGFIIQRSTSTAAGPWLQVGAAPANATSFSDSTGGIVGNQTYFYRVGAANAGGTSYSAPDYAVVAVSVPHPPLGPFLTATSTTVLVTWTVPSTFFDNEEGYKIDRGTDATNLVEVGSVPLNTTIFFDDGLLPGTYYYRVRAWNAVGETPTTSTASIIVL